MIEPKTLMDCQKDGVDLLVSLSDHEKAQIDSLCAYACSEILQASLQQKTNVQKALSDAFLYGMALGLKLQVSDRELKAR